VQTSKNSGKLLRTRRSTKLSHSPFNYEKRLGIEAANSACPLILSALNGLTTCFVFMRVKDAVQVSGEAGASE
jgi:hypothetical protein